MIKNKHFISTLVTNGHIYQGFGSTELSAELALLARYNEFHAFEPDMTLDQLKQESSPLWLHSIWVENSGCAF